MILVNPVELEIRVAAQLLGRRFSRPGGARHDKRRAGQCRASKKAFLHVYRSSIKIKPIPLNLLFALSPSKTSACTQRTTPIHLNSFKTSKQKNI